ncbi:MAG: DoxX family membrane protein [Desulfovibrio sp.]|nr:DoxX family membrane protein [Desulfovibrio sp.]
MKALAVLLRMLMAGIFLYASYDKILHPADFAAIIKDYRILPDILVNPAAIILPWLEMILGLLLLAGKWLEGALFLVNALMLLFWTALVVNAFRGIDIGCGCFSTAKESGGNMVWYIFRDGFFVLLSLAAWYLGVFKKNISTKMSTRCVHDSF